MQIESYKSFESKSDDQIERDHYDQYLRFQTDLEFLQMLSFGDYLLCKINQKILETIDAISLL